MGFGKRAPGAWTAKSDAGSATGPWRPLVATALLGLLIGLGATSAATMVRASERGLLNGLFETIFGVGAPTPVPIAKPASTPPRRYAALPDATRSVGNRLVQRTPRFESRPVSIGGRERSPSPAAFAAGTRTVCVRRCDGYVFPLGRLRSRTDLPIHAAACAAACPNAPTDLFTLAPGRSELDQAVGLDGRAYRRTASANLFRRIRVENCSCQPPDVAGPLMPLAADRTLRPGDVVGSEEGADLVAGLSPKGPALVDYRIAALGRHPRDAIEDRVGALRRDAARLAFREVLRAARTEPRRLRVAEAQIMPARIDAAPAGFAPVAARGEGFAPVRVVSPSPFGR
ncbi:DUF2865 domain-containing protein [Methylorubrum populi]|uniref:DUF2865 domain-containing protein n=1 Tax=Methylorubrum populi TaxID=223967 RepID=A0A833N094_9HYPH|nr:DUF2865 domain-containing protein [Methylorubrum populi]KAB7784873.1 hypothetical protein F8B43_2906 [Methylorubrum populi]